MSGKGRFVKNSLLFMLGSGLSKALGIIMLPLYTTQIPTSDYGAYDISLTLITIVSSIAYFELWSAVLRFMYDCADGKGKASVVRSGLVLMGGATLLFAALGSLMCATLSLNHPIWVMAYGFAAAAATFFCFVARGYGKNKEFAASGVLSSVVIAASNLVLILVLHVDYAALYMSYVLGSLAQCLYLSQVIRLGSVLRKAEGDSGLTKRLLAFAAPLCLNTASYWLLSSAARLVFNYMCGDAATGVFSVGNKFGQVIVLATTCFTYAWQDLSFSESSKGAGGDFFTRACSQYFVFLTAAFAVLLPVVRLVFPVFVHGDYCDALNLVPLALVVALASGYSGFVGNVFYAIKKTKTITVSTIVAGIVSVGSSPLLIEALGANGVNAAVLLGFIVNISIRSIVLRRQVGFRLCIGRVLACSAWIAASCVAFLLGFWWSIVAFVISLGIACYVYRNDISSMLKKLPNRKAQS